MRHRKRRSHKHGRRQHRRGRRKVGSSERDGDSGSGATERCLGQAKEPGLTAHVAAILLDRYDVVVPK